MSKRTIAIGDIHARTIWKDIVAKETQADRIIFIGDYFDNYELTPAVDQLQNFLDICELKVNRAKEGKETILLIGNHDYHYMNNGTYDCYSGFQKEAKPLFNEALTRLQKLLQMAFIDENSTIYSHAGITNSWLDRWYINSKHGKVITNTINSMFIEHPDRFKFYEADYSGYGNNENQSPIWVRPTALVNDKIDNALVVGHTKVKHICNDPEGKIYMIDCLDSSNEYLVVTGDKYEVEKL